jgi:hypothetical protein
VLLYHGAKRGSITAAEMQAADVVRDVCACVRVCVCVCACMPVHVHVRAAAAECIAASQRVC